MKETAKTTAKTRKAPKKPVGYQPRFSELDQYLFGQATHYDIFRKMGAHLDKKDGKVGAWFTVWAPHAAEVSVIGEFNGWDAHANVMRKVGEIKKRHSDCAVTLSLGEKSREDYEALFNAGADRYLLRHETADEEHYKKLHPAEMSWKNRMECLSDLKEIGYQTGCGMMIGSPYQTVECLAEDMEFMCGFKPEMIGIGPFLPHKDTPFRNCPQGSYELTLFLLSICRIMLPDVLLPATTALGTINPKGREQGVLSGANVIMPNLSPVAVRKKYMLYDNKICTGDESAQCRACLERRMESIGYKIKISRGDHR